MCMQLEWKESLEDYNICKRELKKEIRREKWSHEMPLANKIKKNIKIG